VEKNVDFFTLAQKGTCVPSNYERILKKRSQAFPKKDRTEPRKIESCPPEKKRHPTRHSKITAAATGDPQLEASRAGSSRVEMVEARGHFVRCFLEPAVAGSSRFEVRLELAEHGGIIPFQFGKLGLARAFSSWLQL